MPSLQPLPRKSLAILLISAILCVMAVESMGSKKVPPCCTSPAAAERPVGQGSPAPKAADIPVIASEPNRFLPIAPADAEQLNDERPLAERPLQVAPPVHVPSNWDAAAREAARRCLATAVYYEAAGEGWHGELGVAQVVLNRVRHPAYPKTICGTVYQGSNLPTGCQFTFTCDGRLARPPSPAGWKQAQAVADAALSGAVEPRVGMSTHYHTRSVVPYWAGSLDKLAVLGNHIFYTFAGSAGNRRAFSGQLLADAGPPVPPPLPLDPEKLVEAPAVGLALTRTLPSGTTGLKADAPVSTRLAADERGTLAANGGTFLGPGSSNGQIRSPAGVPLR